jgi:hypothetical protein
MGDNRGRVATPEGVEVMSQNTKLLSIIRKYIKPTTSEKNHWGEIKTKVCNICLSPCLLTEKYQGSNNHKTFFYSCVECRLEDYEKAGVQYIEPKYIEADKVEYNSSDIATALRAADDELEYLKRKVARLERMEANRHALFIKNNATPTEVKDSETASSFYDEFFNREE